MAAAPIKAAGPRTVAACSPVEAAGLGAAACVSIEAAGSGAAACASIEVTGSGAEARAPVEAAGSRAVAACALVEAAGSGAVVARALVEAAGTGSVARAPMEAAGSRAAVARAPVEATRPRAAAARRGSRLALPVGLALLALPLITAAHHSRPAPYGDHITVHARVDADSADPELRTKGHTVEAYDPATGRARWTYGRAGHRPLALFPAPGHAVALWSDGLVTDTARADGSAVRWHRAIPGSASWLRTPAARGAAGVLQSLDPRGRMIAVVTPHRIAAYRSADGDLRWVLPARGGCAFEPARSVRHGAALLVAQPCRDAATPWTSQLIAMDDLGRIVPRRTPLGNELPGAAPDGVPNRAEKVFARPR
ncbi:hypothetical protein AB0O76_37860 [Streptomyces sp. NPDC086554]|uniref:hypothetical protein n=1 Tax=Streptomyces sp. NPDC086554 TaxID=3154864 RepID=UPI0034335E00